MNSFVRDLKIALRGLGRSPGFATVAVVTLALGIGANSALFSVVDAVLLKPLPFAEPEDLVMMWESAPAMGFDEVGFSPPDLNFISQQQQSFSSIGAYDSLQVELSGQQQRAERITACRATSGVFETLGVAPLQGRFLASEDDPPGQAVVVLSYGLWQRRYQADPAIVGQPIFLNRAAHTVIGVMPPQFLFPTKGLSQVHQPADVWIPRGFSQRDFQAFGNMFNHGLIARLKSGVSFQAARTELDALSERMMEQYPAQFRAAMPGVTIGIGMAPAHEKAVGATRAPLLILLGAVGLVLLIGCVNVANLLLARAAARSREVAVRRALGASRWRLVRQTLSESLLLGAMGGALGLVFAATMLPALLSLSPAGLPTAATIGINSSVLAFTLLVSLATAMLFSLVPALGSFRLDVARTLQSGNRGDVGGVSRRTQGLLVVSQMALAVVLLVGAGLLLRSFARLIATDPGFQSEQVLSLTVPLPLAGYPQANQIRTLYRDLLENASALPGVESAGMSTDLPLVTTEVRAVQRADQPPQQDFRPPATTFSWVKGDYLSTMEIPLLRGRLFTPEDRAGSASVAIISRSLAQQLWGEDDPIGGQILGGGGAGSPQTVIGVVGDVKDGSLATAARPHAYASYDQQPDGILTTPLWGAFRELKLAVRFRGDEAALTAAVRAELMSLDPDLAVSDIRLMDEIVGETVAPQRFAMTLLALFAGLALALSAIGLYGVVSYSVNRRMQELGLRTALGAGRGDLLQLVFRQGALLTGISLAIGLPAAFALSRLMQSMLYGISPTDPVSYLLIPFVLAAITLLACYLPARRAARVDPMQALRYE